MRLQAYSQLKTVLGYLYDQDASQVRKALDELTPLARQESVGQNYNPLTEIFRSIEGRLQDGSHLLSLPDRKDLIDRCNEVRLQLVASAIGFEALSRTPQAQSFIEHFSGTDLEKITGPIVHGLSGMTHATVGDTRIIVLPKILIEEQVHQVYSDLVNLEDSTSPLLNWVMDFSMIQELPLLLLANVIAYQSRLRRLGRELFLFWVKPELFAPAQLPRMIEHFQLHEIGGTLFSRWPEKSTDPEP